MTGKKQAKMTGVCEHGDHAAPAEHRFCSSSCDKCESADFDPGMEDGVSTRCCAGLCLDERVAEACAHAAHEANRAYCLALGDLTQPTWENAPDWQRSSAINGVRGVLLNGNTPEQSHQNWLSEKLATGWKYGPVKDPDLKEHPCFVPYAKLPAEQKAKDSIFVTTVRTIAAALDQKWVS